jgi:uncharacterized MAPEG superfamily protein
MNPTLASLLGFAAWYVLLSFALGAVRVGLVFSGKKAANTFAANGSDLSPLGQRVTRARDNCYETLPLFAALVLVATLTGKTAATDPLAPWVLAARIAQSLTHLASTSVPAVVIRATLFFIQTFIYAWWCIALVRLA